MKYIVTVDSEQEYYSSTYLYAIESNLDKAQIQEMIKTACDVFKTYENDSLQLICKLRDDTFSFYEYNKAYELLTLPPADIRFDVGIIDAIDSVYSYTIDTLDEYFVNNIIKN